MKLNSILRQVLMGFLVFAGASSALALAPSTSIDLNDVVAFSQAPDDVAFAQTLIQAVNADSSKFGVPADLQYSSSGLTALNMIALYSIHIQNFSDSGDRSSFDVFTLFSKGSGVGATKTHVLLSHSGGKLKVDKPLRFDFSTLPLTARIDIFNRQMSLAESTSGFLKFYPLSLGALVNRRIGDTQSGYTSLSPVLANAVLSKSESEISRTTPDYYKGRPFLRIVDHNQSDYGGFTPFGVHYRISDDFQRGFVSNGCFRLRDNDLYELGTLVFTAASEGVSLSSTNQLVLRNAHPYPLINDWYNSPRVTTDANGNPTLAKDEHGLFFFDHYDQDPTRLLTGK